MSKKSTLFFFLALAIVLGAFGAHGLKKMVDAERIESFKTGVMYHLLMTIGLMVVRFSASFQAAHLSGFRWIFIGTCLFSGSIYLLVFNAIFNWPINAFIGPITPIGGVLMIVGWIQLGIIYCKNDDEK
jgi:uncharacterized membrane protein YgdD (TMEM256/DUF423 family)